ncbi:hypothetical protein [Pelagicoccus mobilis]|uniref:Uncharacterized protein n=1 Tax=Pelagicoccus mobilis TaxID=415221 RepID=A0A934RYB7_9BACT|nr:hypothetical protein [Pelagicoccus mobilis]MBK1877725.1 hypothetical protein [Pelagicoccus mobilis]
MKRIFVFTTVLAGSWASAQHASAPTASAEEQQGMTLPDYISQIAEADEITAADYHNMAQGTLEVANAIGQQGQKMPEPPLKDALDAVEAGRNLAPELADWNEIEQKLLELLNPPEQQEQEQQQDQQNSDQNSEEQEGGEDQQQQGQDGEQNQESSEDGQQSESEGQEGEQQQSDQQQDSQSQEGESQESQDQQDGQQGEQGQDGQEGELPPAKDGAQMGNLEQPEEQQDVQLDGQEAQQTPPEQMQTLGGQQASGEPIQADKAAIRQMLEQLKQQDEPGKLYKILQEAQQGQKKKSQPNAKDW